MELAPNDHLLYSNRSLVYLKLDNPDAALADAERCLKLEPQFVKVPTVPTPNFLR